jgi:DNA gyrase subunit A
MQLQRLTGLERQKILDELAELLKVIERLLAILASDRLLMQIVVDELRKGAGEVRRRAANEILADEGEFRIEDLIAEEDMAITVSNTGYIKRTAITNYRNQRRGGKGRIGMRTREEDFVSHLFVASTHAYIMIFSDRGRAYWLKVHEIPDVGPDGRGKADRQPRLHGGRRAHRGAADREGVRGRQVHRHGHTSRGGQED